MSGTRTSRPQPTYATDPIADPVDYASDTKRDLSPTPATLIGDVDGVGDRLSNLSVA